MSSGNEHGSASGDSDANLSRERRDYAWKWFDYHAKQRVSMFNFFLIASGLLATAYVNTLCKGEELLGVAIAISILGTVIALVFVFLDCRNARLVYLAEDVLRRLEREQLFRGFRGLNEKLDEVKGGIVYRDAVETPGCWGKHKCLLKAVEVVVALNFLVGAVYAIVRYFDP